jgi:GNAT superfamily N-acetyltransferase
MDLTVQPLSSFPDAIPVAAEWHFREWGHTDPGGTLESWTAGMARQAGAETIPGTLLAVAGRVPVGLVCLVGQDMAGYQPAEELTPWLRGLYVTPSARRRGVGAVLVRRCEAWAASLGHHSLYLYTERGSRAEALYQRLGWRPVDTGHYDGMAVTVMRTSLPPAPGATR